MNKVFVFILPLLISAVSKAETSSTCLIETRQKIYHFGEQTPNELKLWLSSDCPNDFNQKLREFLLNARGPVRASQLKRILSESTSTRFDIAPEKLRLLNLQERLEQRFGLSTKQVLKGFRLVDKGSLLLNDHEFLDYECSDCASTGEKSIELKVSNNTTGKSKTRWLKALGVVKTRALVPKSSLRVDQKGLTPQDFESVEVQTKQPEELFTDPKKLVFFRLNKPLGQGEALTHKDLTAINLVKIGTPVNVVLTNKNLSLRYRATALRAAKLGESVKLKAQNSQKIITGKVIDFNKVEIKL